MKKAKKAKSKKTTKRTGAKGIPVVGVDAAAERFHLVYPRIEIHENARHEHWYRWLTGHSQVDVIFKTDASSADEVRRTIAARFDDQEAYSSELATVPVFDLRREQALFARGRS